MLEKGYAREYVKGIVVAVRQFHDWGALEGLWARNGISLVRTPKVPSGLPDPLPHSEARALMAACVRPLEYRLIYGGLYLGNRIGESAVLCGEMFRDGWVRFQGEKGDQWREVPIHPALEAVKWKLLAWPPTYDSTLQRVKRRMEKRTGIRFVAHQLRDTFSSALYDADVPDRIVKALIGHAQDVTGRYIEVSRRRKVEAIAKLDYQT